MLVAGFFWMSFTFDPALSSLLSKRVSAPFSMHEAGCYTCNTSVIRVEIDIKVVAVTRVAQGSLEMRKVLFAVPRRKGHYILFVKHRSCNN